MTRRAPFNDLASLLTWLDELRPTDRVHVARLLADTRTSRELARFADATVYDMTRTASRVDTAAELGTTVRAVQRAITNHIARTGAESRRGPQRAEKDAVG
jgi:hypothetical protein